MNIKCIALDLDKTTLNSEGKLSPENRLALEKAIDKGICVCIASGRAFDTLPKDVLDINGIQYAITSNGAAVYRIQDKKCLRSFVLTEEAVKKILDLTKEYPITYETFIQGKAYTSTEYIENPSKFCAAPQFVEYVRATRTFKPDIKQFILQNAAQLDSLDIIVGDEKLKQELTALISNNIKDIYITSSIEQLIEISYKDSGKRSGVKFIGEYLGISRENIAAFGDADNDIDMLEYAGVGIAVENASQKVQSAADYITLHHDKDGVAYALKNILKCI